MECGAAVLAAVLASTLAGGAAGYYASRASSRKLRRILGAVLEGAVRERDIIRARRRLSTRPRRRYLVFEAVPGGVEPGALQAALEEAARKLAGEVGLALSGLTLIDYKPDTSRGVIRFRHEHKALALAVLGMVREAGGARVLLVPIATTGSLKRARRLLR